MDGNSSVAANPSGVLYVTPNNPAALSVLVDPAFNLPQAGATGAYLFNGAASAVTVTLTAPGSNSYYATIYWDVTTNTAGVVYGATGVSPTPVLPDAAYRTPLACVLLTTGQATVTASNISDVRTLIPQVPVMLWNGSASSNVTLNCNGADQVVAFVGFTVSITITLNNLQVGIPIQVVGNNTSAAAHSYSRLRPIRRPGLPTISVRSRRAPLPVPRST